MLTIQTHYTVLSTGFSLVVVVLGVLCYSSYKLNKEGFPEELRPKRRDLLSRAR